MRFFLKQHFLFLAVLFFYIFIRSSFFDVLPMWDGGGYYSTCLFPALTAPFAFYNFTCSGHPSNIFMILVAILPMFNIASMFLLHLSLLLVGCTALVAFYLLLSEIFKEKKYTPEIAILTLLFAIYPFFFSSTVQLNLDIGTMLFFLFFLTYLLRRQFWKSIIFATACLFTKEPAVMLLAAAVGTYWYIFLRKQKGKRDSYFSLPQYLFIFFLPSCILMTSLLIGKRFFNQTLLWRNIFISVYLPGTKIYIPTIIAYLINLLLLGFNWILLAIIVLAGLKMVLVYKQKIFAYKRTRDTQITQFIALTGILGFLPLLVIITVSHVRYFLPFYPLYFILFFRALLYLFPQRIKRMLVLSGLFGLFFISNFATIDPVSRAIYGVFQFGNHTLLNINSVNHQCCGYGLDGLQYNTESRYLQYIQDQIFADIKPTSETYVLTHKDAKWEFLRPLDKQTYHLTLTPGNNFSPKYISVEHFPYLGLKPKILYFIAFPHMFNEEVLPKLLQLYSIEKTKTYSRDGYSISVYTMKLKG